MHFLVLTSVFALHFLFIIVGIQTISCFSLAIQFASCRDRLMSYSLFNWPSLKGVLHKAAESTAGVCVSGVRAKFSKSSQCVSQWQHMLDSLQRNSRTHNLTCKQATDTQVLFIFTAVRTWCTVMHVHRLIARKCMQIREISISAY